MNVGGALGDCGLPSFAIALPVDASSQTVAGSSRRGISSRGTTSIVSIGAVMPSARGVGDRDRGLRFSLIVVPVSRSAVTVPFAMVARCLNRASSAICSSMALRLAAPPRTAADPMAIPTATSPKHTPAVMNSPLCKMAGTVWQTSVSQR
jgi:hypothetical protein